MAHVQKQALPTVPARVKPQPLVRRLHLVSSNGTPQPVWSIVPRSPVFRGIALFLLALGLHLYQLNEAPGFPHFFEENTLTRELRPGLTARDALHQPWAVRYEVFREWGNGDVDHVGFSWPWVLAVDVSRNLFGETPLAHRLPSAFVAALSPVLFYFFIRRFFRPKAAFLCGLLLATSPLHLTFARNGGYVAATLTLLLALYFCSLLIAVENRAWAWIGFTILLALVPYFYTPARYLGLLAFVPILYVMLRNPAVRRRHLLGLAACIVVWVACAIPNVSAKEAYLHDWKAAAAHAAQMFYSGSGEQFFTADRPEQRRILLHEIGLTAEADSVDYEDPSEVMRKLIVLRIEQWWNVYWLGKRLGLQVSDNPPARYEVARLWPPLILPALAAWGLIYCTWRSVRERRLRELLLVAWSFGTWVPLLLTTQVNGNRTLVGVPPDHYFAAVGFMWIVQPMRHRLSLKARPWLDLLLAAILGLWLVGRVNHYFGALP
jgi:hypothetical protein